MLPLLTPRLFTKLASSLPRAALTRSSSLSSSFNSGLTRVVLSSQRRSFGSSDVAEQPAKAAAGAAKATKASAAKPKAAAKKAPVKKVAAKKPAKKVAKKVVKKKAAPKKKVVKKVKKPAKVILKPSDHPPKYPGNAYSLFLREQFANYPKPPTLADCRVVVTSIAREWRALSDSEKAVYHARYLEVYEKYKDDFRAWLIRTPVEKRKEIDARRIKRGGNKVTNPVKNEEPKRPSGSFFRFANGMRNTDLGFTENAKAAGVAWGHLSAEDKAKYRDAYNADYEHYKVEKAKYDAVHSPSQTSV